MKYVLLVFLLSGCASAQIVRKTYSPEKGGVIKYSSSQLTADAKDQMIEFCRGQYKVVGEDIESQTTGAYTNQYGFTAVQKKDYTYLTFKCVDEFQAFN